MYSAQRGSFLSPEENCTCLPPKNCTRGAKAGKLLFRSTAIETTVAPSHAGLVEAGGADLDSSGGGADLRSEAPSHAEPWSGTRAPGLGLSRSGRFPRRNLSAAWRTTRPPRRGSTLVSPHLPKPPCGGQGDHPVGVTRPVGRRRAPRAPSPPMRRRRRNTHTNHDAVDGTDVKAVKTTPKMPTQAKERRCVFRRDGTRHR